MESTLTSRGQTTIPAGCRRELRLKPGSRIEWTVKEGCMVGRPVEESSRPLAILELAGLLKHPRWKGNTDAWLKEIRGE